VLRHIFFEGRTGSRACNTGKKSPLKRVVLYAINAVVSKHLNYPPSTINLLNASNPYPNGYRGGCLWVCVSWVLLGAVAMLVAICLLESAVVVGCEKLCGLLSHFFHSDAYHGLYVLRLGIEMLRVMLNCGRSNIKSITATRILIC